MYEIWKSPEISSGGRWWYLHKVNLRLKEASKLLGQDGCQAGTKFQIATLIFNNSWEIKKRHNETNRCGVIDDQKKSILTWGLIITIIPRPFGEKNKIDYNVPHCNVAEIINDKFQIIFFFCRVWEPQLWDAQLEI